jgi:ATP-dependent 26S proteasome regulatory subunit
MNKSVEQIKRAILAGHNLIKVVTYEEKRIENLLSQLCEQILKSQNIMFWDINNGLVKGQQPIPGTEEPVAALDAVLKSQENGFYVFRDLAPHIRQSERVVRKLRELYKKLKGSRRVIFTVSSDDFFPDTLKKELEVVRFELPDYDELNSLFQRFLQSMEKSGRKIELTETDRKNFVTGVQGLTHDEAHRAFMKAFQGQKVITRNLIKSIHEEKKHLILKEGVLEFFDHKFSLDHLGGLDNLKDWLMKRKKAFGKEAKDYGLVKPRGMLTMGISGCGKSLSAKIVAALWNLPLFRLDMNLVYSGMSGSPEIVFSRALKTMDSVAPAILWIDEIESGISDKQGEGASSRILGYFLTWMQEHTSDVFIAATANRIDLLPAELLRRGRFDQIFFIDLPTRKEREEIFNIHLKSKENDMSLFNVPQLAQITKGWSGSEIEQVIISGMYEAFNQNRKLCEDDLFAIFGSSVPLSLTMEEQIKKIKSWAHNRAAPASSDKEY